MSSSIPRAKDFYADWNGIAAAAVGSLRAEAGRDPFHPALASLIGDLSLPEESLLIEKATGKVPHTGGERLKEGDAYYKDLIRWLEAKTPLDPPTVPKPTALEIFPKLAVLDGKGGIVGEAGLGKSRLMYEFRESLRDRDVTYREGRCVSYGSAVPYLPVLDMLRQNFVITEADSAESIAEKVYAALFELEMDAEEWAPCFADIRHVFICFNRSDASYAAAKKVQAILPQARIAKLPAEVGEGGVFKVGYMD